MIFPEKLPGKITLWGGHLMSGLGDLHVLMGSIDMYWEV